MSILKTAATTLALSLAIVAPASAALVQGISFDENNTTEVDSPNFLQQLDLVSGELSGWGQISGFNNGGTLIPAGRELTYSYSGYMLDEAASSLSRLIFTNGQVTLYSDGTPNFDINDGTTATDTEFATPWLALEGSFFIDIVGGTLEDGTLSASLTSGFLMLDVTGGAAAPYFDTDTISKIIGVMPNVFGTADVEGGSSVTNYYLNGATTSTPASEFAQSVFLTAAADGVSATDKSVNVLDFFTDNMSLTGLVGTGSIDLTVSAQAVPEPGMLMLLGTGLIGIGLSQRRRKSS